MLLNLSDIKKITVGVESIEENDGKFSFFRFRECEANALIEKDNPNYYKRAFNSAGVRLSFYTDARTLSFDYECVSEPARKLGHFDVYVNGVLSYHFGYTDLEEYKSSFKAELPKGGATVDIYLPWSAKTVLKNLVLRDAGELVPIKREKKILCYGDSITQGFDAEYPSLSYYSRICNMFSADAINKGIAGYQFTPEFPCAKVDYEPEFITVAYGINDWSKYDKAEFKRRCTGFFDALTSLYPDTRIFAISPICYLDSYKPTPFGDSAESVDSYIRECVLDKKNLTVLNGWSFTPALAEFYYDCVLHPNDMGFALYAENLYREIVKNI